MASGEYEIWFTTDEGVRLQPLQPTYFNATRRVNRIGYFTMGLPVTLDPALLKRDYMVQIWRAPAGGRLGLWRVYFLRGWRREHVGSQERLTIWGPDCNDLLRRRIVAHYAASSNATATAVEADDLMKDIVADAIADGTNPSPTAGTRVWSDLSVAGDLTDGPTLTKDFAWKPLLTDAGGGVLSQLADAAREAGTEVFFDIVPDSVSATSITFQFRTYTGQPGQDVTSSVVFSQEDKNLLDPYMEYDYGDELTYVYAGGQGEEDEREIQQVYDAARYGASKWNRCEGFADARDQETANGVREAGRAKLQENRGVVRAGGVPVDTEGTRFGLHWNHGDKVRVRYGRDEFDAIVRATVLRVNQHGEETIDARLDHEA